MFCLTPTGLFLCSKFLNSYCVSPQHFLVRLTKASLFPLRLFFFFTTNLSLVLHCREHFFIMMTGKEVNKKLCLLIFGLKMQLHICNPEGNLSLFFDKLRCIDSAENNGVGHSR